MKKIVLLFSLMTIVLCGSFYAQELKKNKDSYKIITNTSNQSDDYFVKVLSKANIESFRLRDKEVVITFKEGVECVLLPATTLKANGEDINLSGYKDSFPKDYKLPIFSINPNGHLLAEYKKKLK